MAGSNPVRWFEIYVQDMARARRFYEAVFQATLRRLDTGDLEYWAFPDDPGVYGSGGALVRAPGVPSGGTGTMVYFGCEDCTVEAARVEAAGGRVQRPRMSIGQYGHVVIAEDTEGNVIGLHSMA